MSSLSYTPPKEVQGVEALKILNDWLGQGMGISSDHRGFWLMYELMTGTLNFKILSDDSSYTLGALLTRLSSRSGGASLRTVSCVCTASTSWRITSVCPFSTAM